MEENTVEAQYREHYAALPGKAKIVRTLALFDQIYAMVRRKVFTDAGALEERELRRRVAQCLYRTEPVVQAMLASCAPCKSPSSK
jgi:hypothetical protein